MLILDNANYLEYHFQFFQIKVKSGWVGGGGGGDLPCFCKMCMCVCVCVCGGGGGGCIIMDMRVFYTVIRLSN